MTIMKPAIQRQCRDNHSPIEYKMLVIGKIFDTDDIQYETI